MENATATDSSTALLPLLTVLIDARVALPVTETAHLRELVTEWRASDHAALRVAADELARRLETLNGAHAEAIRVQATFLSKEAFDAYVADVARQQVDAVKWRETVEVRFSRQVGWGMAAAVFLTLVEFALNYLKK